MSDHPYAMQTKFVPPILFIGVQEVIPQSEIPAFADRAVGPLYETLTAAGLETAGDLHFMCAAFNGPDVPSLIQIAVPVMAQKPVPAPYEYWESPEFCCAWRDHRGPISTIQGGWGDFVDGLLAHGARLGTGWREIYKYWVAPDSDANLTELQRELLSCPTSP